ncbi:uncharacterized protein LOC131323218 [Rhododendron vialii]|uniref:uncharacterized protein LOC131323218 n=1 Tax=Rhododendron vialii TaxID=182163 RepID=UPI00265EA380|nr:uncharacterized protein LOC131323218 [Rhododendron vialii]
MKKLQAFKLCLMEWQDSLGLLLDVLSSSYQLLIFWRAKREDGILAGIILDDGHDTDVEWNHIQEWKCWFLEVVSKAVCFDLVVVFGTVLETGFLSTISVFFVSSQLLVGSSPFLSLLFLPPPSSMYPFIEFLFNNIFAISIKKRQFGDINTKIQTMEEKLHFLDTEGKLRQLASNEIEGEKT